MYNPDEQGPREIVCPRCGAEASWRFLDPARKRIEIACADCGVFEIPRLKFEQAESDVAELNDLG